MFYTICCIFTAHCEIVSSVPAILYIISYLPHFHASGLLTKGIQSYPETKPRTFVL